MRFKYYLRGIGIGITLATLLLTISFYFGRDNLVICSVLMKKMKEEKRSIKYG